MRIYVAGIIGLCLILTGCPGKHEKTAATMPAPAAEQTTGAPSTTTEMAMPANTENAAPATEQPAAQ